MPWTQKTFTLKSRPRGFHLVTGEIVAALPELAGIRTGLLHLFLQHTSASLTINENADPDVTHDLTKKLSSLIPQNDEYRHAEGNSDSHLKASLVGAQETIIINNGKLVLGTWQSIYFCEFDGPRSRKVFVKVV